MINFILLIRKLRHREVKQLVQVSNRVLELLESGCEPSLALEWKLLIQHYPWNGKVSIFLVSVWSIRRNFRSLMNVIKLCEKFLPVFCMKRIYSFCKIIHVTHNKLNTTDYSNNILFETIVGSHWVVENDIQGSCINFIQFPSIAASCITLVQYDNQEIDVDAI